MLDCSLFRSWEIDLSLILRAVVLFWQIVSSIGFDDFGRSSLKQDFCALSKFDFISTMRFSRKSSFSCRRRYSWKSAFLELSNGGLEKVGSCLFSTGFSGLSDCLSKGLSMDRSRGLSKGFSDGLSKGFSDGLSNCLSDGLSWGFSCSFSCGSLSDGLSEGLPDGFSDSLSKGLSFGFSTCFSAFCKLFSFLSKKLFSCLFPIPLVSKLTVTLSGSLPPSFPSTLVLFPLFFPLHSFFIFFPPNCPFFPFISPLKLLKLSTCRLRVISPGGMFSLLSFELVLAGRSFSLNHGFSRYPFFSIDFLCCIRIMSCPFGLPTSNPPLSSLFFSGTLILAFILVSND